MSSSGCTYKRIHLVHLPFEAHKTVILKPFQTLVVTELRFQFPVVDLLQGIFLGRIEPVGVLQIKVLIHALANIAQESHSVGQFH